MNLTMTVKMTLRLFLLCSGYSHITFASNRLRVFRIPDMAHDQFNVSLRECNQTNESFVTLYDEEDANFTEKFVNNLLGGKPAWLGLHKGRITTWSDGAPVIFNQSSVDVTNREQICEAIDNGTWTGFNCTDTKYFMCYKGINYTLIKSKKTWCQALQYCRKHYTDLVSISNETQNEDVITEGNNTSFWIGLLHDDWEWTDRSCSSFRKWANENTTMGTKRCTQVKFNNEDETLLFDSTCFYSAHSFCSRGITRIKVIDLKLTWEQAFDYCKANHTGLLWIKDKEDQTAVEQWLNHTHVPGPFWIGLRQSRVFGFWIWSDRTVTYSNWKDGTQPELPMSNHCGVIDTDYRWSDEDCWVPQHFLCEEEIVFMNRSMGG